MWIAADPRYRSSCHFVLPAPATYTYHICVTQCLKDLLHVRPLVSIVTREKVLFAQFYHYLDTRDTVEYVVKMASPQWTLDAYKSNALT